MKKALRTRPSETNDRTLAGQTAEPADSGSASVIQRGRRITDSVELGRDGISRSAGNEIRHDLVARVRAQIAAGEYDSPAKMEAAAERLASRLDLLA